MVTSIGSTGAQNLVRMLRAKAPNDWFIVAGDASPEHGGLGLAHKDVHLPRGDDPTYVERLISCLQAERIELLVPVMEAELKRVTEHRARFEAMGVQVLLSPSTTIQTCMSKKRLAHLLDSLNIDTPAMIDPHTEPRFPIFARPDFGSGSRGAHQVKDLAELDRLRAQNQHWTLTEWIEGQEFSIDGFSFHGDLVHAVCRSRDEVRNGLAFRSTVVELGAREALLVRLCKSLEIHGFFNFQFRRTESGRETYFDLNPRLGGAMVLSFAAGLDPDRLLKGVLAGRVDGSFSTQVGLKLYRRYENIFVNADGALL